jgi:hypothetical protein
MNAELLSRVSDWCKANRQWGRALNVGYARFKVSEGHDATFWRAVLRQYAQVEED